MKRFVVVLLVLSFFVISCSTTLKTESAERLSQIKNVTDITIFYWTSRRNWYVSVETKTKCGEIKFQQNGRDLDQTINKVIEQINCAKGCMEE